MKEKFNKWFEHVMFKLFSKKFIAMVVVNVMLYLEKLDANSYVILMGVILGVNLFQKFTTGGNVNDTTKE